MGRKTKDPFGFKNLSRRMTLASNRMTGRMAEDSFAMSQRIQGHEVRKTHKGRDFQVQKRDLFGRKIGKPISYEVKTGGSELTEAQRRRKARLGRRYKVVRY
jgi:hypothetical protein